MLPRGSKSAVGIIRGAAKSASAAAGGGPASPATRSAAALPAASKAKPYVCVVPARHQTTAARDDGGAAAGGDGGEHHLSGTAGTYLEEMYESWSRDPTSVHASWDAYFRGSTYTPPPNVGNTKANEGTRKERRILRTNRHLQSPFIILLLSIHLLGRFRWS